MTPAENEISVILPGLGEGVTEATITRWLKTVGDTVELDEPLLEVATDKVDTEIPAPAAGTVVQIVEPEDALVAVGAVVATLGIAAPTRTATPVSAPPADPIPQPIPADAEEPPPAARLDGGASADRVEKLPRIRRTIARRMVESLHTAAQLTTVVEADLTSVAIRRAEMKQQFHERTGSRLSYLPFIAVAAVDALAEHPIINATVDSECSEVTYHGSVHLGMAVDSTKGLMVPVIRDAQHQGVVEMATAIASAAAAVRDGSIAPDDLSGGTFTITNTGSRGALFDTPIINQPQSAILGVGAVTERLVPEHDTDGALLIRIRPMAYLSLTYDHRLIDGADAARYLTSVRARLESWSRGISGDEPVPAGGGARSPR
ncbi:dihydrolipoamide acyltransferase [Mycolicibacterium canariasense]|uniref:Dihydrolipoamide acetyltransferase component of pyruvate dehydrogenase complex n=1 Tax=Mycolicibacterium canariasense TaxID=228230 RepID=A0A100WHG5_MYCCR|nr:2-oxo acid dehydrogenase subunit E2 [Mycolicibacterium canariasense]MCV7211733.1 2-oxo acid dehydrogenase subunit E2 [Mycolicibacterium canariasense]ORV08189.1 dihydrolipoyllysine succinyltransferase [Mycolicibacterium canariasense]GAS98260.1 dihydrolipoamide acyltransferase [Mycolicibacterium canariasense]